MENSSIQKSITAFLCSMKFKPKWIGGIDEEDVLNKIEQITKLYREWVTLLQDQNTALQQENSLLQHQLKQHQQELHTTEEHLSALRKDADAMQQEDRKLKAKTQELIDLIRRQDSEREALFSTIQTTMQTERSTVQAQCELEPIMEIRQPDI